MTEDVKTGTRPAVYAWSALIAAVAGFAAVYVTFGSGDNVAGQSGLKAKPPAVAAGKAKAPKSAPAETRLNRGEMATFVFKAKPAAIADVAFVDAAGASKTLKDWKGRYVLLNLWATWCAPCRKEMPHLDRLQAELGSKDFEVLALNLDRNGIDKAKAFLDKIGIKALKFYADPTAKAGIDLKAIGMPTTIFINRDGLEIGRLVGPAVWDSEDAKRLVRSRVK